MSTFAELKEACEATLAKLKPIVTRLQTSGGNKDAQREANSEASRLIKGAPVISSPTRRLACAAAPFAPVSDAMLPMCKLHGRAQSPTRRPHP